MQESSLPPRRRHRPRKAVARGSGLPASLQAVHLNAAGIDIGSAEHYVAVPADRDPQPVRRFECFTADLELRAILAGERDPVQLAALKDPRVRSSREQIAKALHGDCRAEHLFALQQSLKLYDTYRTMIAECDEQIEHCLAGFDTRVDLAAHPLEPPKHGCRTPQGNAPGFDLRAHLYRIAGVDFTRIDGFDALTVLG